jgi:hypothetical protein
VSYFRYYENIFLLINHYRNSNDFMLIVKTQFLRSLNVCRIIYSKTLKNYSIKRIYVGNYANENGPSTLLLLLLNTFN